MGLEAARYDRHAKEDENFVNVRSVRLIVELFAGSCGIDLAQLSKFCIQPP